MTDSPIEITRYPNRRYYDRSKAQYVTLSEIEQLVRDGHTVVVRDSKSGEDLTRTVLAQIILERFPERMDLFPAPLLHMVLRANDLALDWLRTYLRQTLAFLEHLPPPPLPAVPPFAPPLVTPLGRPTGGPLDWMQAFFPTWSATNPAATNPAAATSDSVAPAPPAANSAPVTAASAGVGTSTPAAEETRQTPPDATTEPNSPVTAAESALTERLAELERRLRELESGR